MKRRDLIKVIKQIAKDKGLPYREVEGAKHTKVWVGARYQTVPRHNEIAEQLAQSIIEDLKED